jgi:serine/threonine protein kinase
MSDHKPATDPGGLPATEVEGAALLPAPAGWRPPASTLPGHFGKYRLDAYLGKGGMGQVWALLGADHLPGEPLAIKFLWHPQLLGEDLLFQAFRREAQAGVGISHQFITHAHEFLDLREHVAAGWPPAALVMTRHAVSLSAVLDDIYQGKTRLPPELVIEFARDLALGLHFLHGKKGLVHRDLKPANVLLSLREGLTYDPKDPAASLVGANALLADLGVACHAGTKPPLLLHQDHWKAPELFDPETCRPLSDRHADPAEDVYSFGLLLRALSRTLEEPPAWLTEVVGQCTSHDPAVRPHASPELLLRLSPDWRIQDYMVRGGWKPAAHPHFTGRQFVFTAFEQFRHGCSLRGRGGVFVIEGDAGVGKTALLNTWASRGERHPTFFFRQTEGRVSVPVMLETLFEVLCRRYQVTQSLPARPERYADALEGLLRHIAAERLGPDDLLLLLVDALDEASDPMAAAQALPKDALPRGVFLVVSSRPATGPGDHLAVLYAAGAHQFLLRGDDQANLADVAAYLLDTLGRRLTGEQAEALARASGGIFLLAVLLLEAIQEGRLTVAEALEIGRSWAKLPQAKRMFSWYRESWQRITRTLALDQRQDLEQFLRLLAAAQAPLAERQVLDILGWQRQSAVLDTVLEQVMWFLDRKVEAIDGHEEAYLQLRHQSVQDFLVSLPYHGPARNHLDEMHARIGEHYLRQARAKGWARVEPYGRSYAVRHLWLSKRPEQLAHAAACLTDLEYLQATLGEMAG